MYLVQLVALLNVLLRNGVLICNYCKRSGGIPHWISPFNFLIEFTDNPGIDTTTLGRINYNLVSIFKHKKSSSETTFSFSLTHRNECSVVFKCIKPPGETQKT